MTKKITTPWNLSCTFETICSGLCFASDEFDSWCRDHIFELDWSVATWYMPSAVHSSWNDYILFDFDITECGNQSYVVDAFRFIHIMPVRAHVVRWPFLLLRLWRPGAAGQRCWKRPTHRTANVLPFVGSCDGNHGKMFNRYLGSQSKGGLAECRYQTDGQSHPYESPEMHSETMSKFLYDISDLQCSSLQLKLASTGLSQWSSPQKQNYTLHHIHLGCKLRQRIRRSRVRNHRHTTTPINIMNNNKLNKWRC